MTIIALFLAAALGSSARAADDLVVDLSEQFPSECRSQDNVGACHTFSAVALLEAAIKRKAKEQVELSDADLFVQATIAAKGIRPVFMRARMPNGKDELLIDYVDGGWPHEDLETALDKGVALRDAFSWDDFREAYNGYRFSYAKLCRAAQSKDQRDALERQAKDGAAKAEDACKPELGDSVREFATLLGSEGGKETAARGLSFAGKELAKSRAEGKKRLAGLKAGHKLFEPASAADAADKKKCLERGADARQAILTQFAAERPVAICFLTAGLKQWGGGPDDGHCVVLTGYVRNPEGRYRFTIRNSWIVRRSAENPVKRFFVRTEDAPYNPDFYDADLCRVAEVAWVEP